MSRGPRSLCALADGTHTREQVMAQISGAVYDPPRKGLPALTVVFGADGDVILARCLPTRLEAEALLAQIQESVQAKINQELGGKP